VMEDEVLKVENISKSYGSVPVLENVSFSVKRGEVLGIIGPNGAGKSTLLKILSGNTKPDKGSVCINGKIISILDIGAGFHPDLSGLDNIYLIASLYNLKRENVDTVIDKIIDFSESKDYIDNMVKTYSSGMYLRVAFSLFIHLDFDILILDEVLSVGDVKFMKKTYDILSILKYSGKTILLITHNLNEIKNFCNRVVYLNLKIILDSFDINDILIKYLNDVKQEFSIVDKDWVYREEKKMFSISDETEIFTSKVETEIFKLQSISFCKNKYKFSDDINLSITYLKKSSHGNIALVLKLFDIFDNMVWADSICFRKDYKWDNQKKGTYHLNALISSKTLNKGKYFVNILLVENMEYMKSWHGIVSFDIDHDSWFNNMPWRNIPANILLPMDWQISIKSDTP
jgi:ABC-type polysaccharide/polyol phosphate transport system ATPase subunit